MITEDYVSFEIAKLLKEKGFTGDEIHKYYDVSDEKPILYSESYIHEFDKDFWIIDLIMAPTLQMVMKWLREVHNFHIWVEPNNDKEGLYNAHVKVGWWLNNWAGVGYNTYEAACEAAIKCCLENLNNYDNN